MRRILVGALLVSTFMPMAAFAQASPSQITNDDLLRLIGLQQVQNLQCGKALEAAEQAVAAAKKEANKNAPVQPTK